MSIRRFILLAFALSGMTALIYEVAWARPLQLIFGSTIYSVSTILTTFFVGAALGALIIRNLADKTRNPLAVFAGLQLGIGACGFVILYLFRVLPSAYLYLAGTNGMQFVQFLLLFLVLIIPTTLFGATWPVANKIYIDQEKLGKDSGKLYSYNSFGSFAGSLSAGFILIPILGITATSMLVSSINILVAIMSFIYAREAKDEA